MKPSTLVRLALAGSRTDTLRVVLTALSAALATLAILAAATVIAIPELGRYVNNTQYRSSLIAEPGLRGGVVFALVLLTLPVLALAAQCGRLGAPARDRRLAAIRMAGATPRQTLAIVAAETGMASAFGAALSFAVYFAGRRTLDRPDAEGELALPTDVLPASWALAAIAAGLPLVATLVSAVLLRRVAVTPFGVVRRVRAKRPDAWPGFLIVPGVVAFMAIQPLSRYLERHNVAAPSWVGLVMMFGGALFTLVGVVLGTGWITYASGRVLHRFARRPAALLAARRLVADPWAGSRTLAALLAGVIFGAGAAGVRAWFASDFAVEDESLRLQAAAEHEPYVPTDHTFYFRSLDLVNAAVMVALAIAATGLLVALAEGIVSRRRAHAALVATGVPRGVLARSTVWQVLAPAIPAILVALAVGVTLPRGLATESSHSGSVCTGDGTTTQCVQTAEVVRKIPLPLDDLALLGAGTLAAVLIVVGLGLLFLRPSTAVEELRTT